MYAQGDLKSSFTAFASYGAGGKEMAEMESKNFFKCIKDSGLIDKVRISRASASSLPTFCAELKILLALFAGLQVMTQTDCDLIFTKVKTKGARKINYGEFCAALDSVAAKKKVLSVTSA
jgi:hypothetical protein